MKYYYFVDPNLVNSEDPEETPDYFTVEDDDFGLKSLVIFKSAATYLSHNDCYHGHKSRNSITLHATVCYTNAKNAFIYYVHVCVTSRDDNFGNMYVYVCFYFFVCVLLLCVFMCVCAYICMCVCICV